MRGERVASRLLKRNFDRFQEALEAPAADPDLADVPGGTTGFVALKSVQLVKAADPNDPNSR